MVACRVLITPATGTQFSELIRCFALRTAHHSIVDVHILAFIVFLTHSIFLSGALFGYRRFDLLPKHLAPFTREIGLRSRDTLGIEPALVNEFDHIG